MREHNARMSLAWHIEALHRSKRLPRLNEIMVTQEKRSRQSWKQQYAIMEQLAARQRRIQRQQAR